MIISHAELNIANYQIQIAQDDQGHVYCFKHNASMADFEYFDSLEDATDYIFSGLPEFKYVVKSQE